MTRELLDRWATLRPSSIPVYGTRDERQIGHCVRLWRKGRELWAVMEIDAEARWYDAGDPRERAYARPLHCESLIDLSEPRAPQLKAVIATDLPRGVCMRLLGGRAEGN